MSAIDFRMSYVLWISSQARRQMDRESRQLTTEEAMDLDVMVAGDEDLETRL